VSLESVTGVAKKKVLGVPVLYLLGGGVVVLALYAYKTKAVVPADTAVTSAATADTAASELYPPDTVGTVIVSPATGSTAGSNTSITTNDEWLKAGVAYLGTLGISPGTAQVALNTYLEGAQLSYLQGEYRDQVITQIGMPPTLSTPGGTDAKLNPQALQTAIQEAYRTYLYRDALPSEITTWVNSGKSANTIISEIQGSPDAVRNYSINSYYVKYVLRPAKAIEIQNWIPVANAKGLPEVEKGIANSNEAKAAQGLAKK
jgi:hypothetical protein